jgi:hypothetical protein
LLLGELEQRVGHRRSAGGKGRRIDSGLAVVVEAAP